MIFRSNEEEHYIPYVKRACDLIVCLDFLLILWGCGIKYMHYAKRAYDLKVCLDFLSFLWKVRSMHADQS